MRNTEISRRSSSAIRTKIFTTRSI